MLPVDDERFHVADNLVTANPGDIRSSSGCSHADNDSFEMCLEREQDMFLVEDRVSLFGSQLFVEARNVSLRARGK